MNEIYAEDVNYWQTSKSSPDQWIEKAVSLIVGIGGIIHMEAFGHDHGSGKSAYAIGFSFGNDRFKIVWPVLPSKSGNTLSAKRQAATMLYHDVKSRCLSALVLGARTSFFSFIQLPNGMSACELDSDGLQIFVGNQSKLLEASYE